jgi:hypothetical protein
LQIDVKFVIDVLTLAIVAATCVAGLRQLTLNRSSSQLKAMLAIQSDFRDHELQLAFTDVQNNLSARLESPDYRASLEKRGFIDSATHSEVLVCNWFEGVGVNVKYELVSENAFMDLYGRLVTYYWELTAPAIALMRRTRGRTQYHNFEYLATRARAWTTRYPEGIFPKSHGRIVLDHVWDDESLSLSNPQGRP